MEVKKSYPNDWKRYNLLEIVDLIHGKAHEPYIVPNGRYKVVNSKFVSTEGAVVKYSDVNDCPAIPDDVLMVLSDLPNGKALAKCYYVERPQVYAVNQRVCIYRPRKVSGHFLYYALNRNKYFLALDDGVTQTHILNRDISGCEIVIPPTITEQRTIATALSDTDALIAALDRLIAKKKAIKQGAMQELLTGKRRLEGFEGEWEVKKLGDVVYSIASGKSNTNSSTGDFPIYGSTGIIGFQNFFDYSGEKILVARVGANAGTLNMVNGKYCVSDNTLMVSCNKQYHTNFAYYHLLSLNLNSLVFGSGQPLITGTQLKSLEIYIPTSFAEQTAIAQILTDMDAEIASLEQQRDKYKVVKQGMMQELLTGKTRLI